MSMQNQKPMTWKFSERAQKLQSSVIREILKITMRPEVISFAGGLPSPKTFPIDRMRAAFDKVLSENGPAALQYGPTDGYAPLREFLANSLSTPDCKISADQVLMVSGSQQGLDLLGKVLIDEDDKILLESPSYLGALQAFSVYQPEFASVDMDDSGVIPSDLEAKAKGAKLFYALPNFQNPTGRTLSVERRKEIVEICARFGIPLIEDNPYGELCYSGEPLPKMLNMNPDGVIYMGSFSKILTPGIRLGYVVGPAPLIRKLEQAKQASDLHTSTLTQMVVYEVIKDGFLNEHIPHIRTFYASQCDVMIKAMEKHFPPSVTWVRPEGGMFIWANLPKNINSQELLDAAIANNVAFVPGGPFYASNPETHTFRLSFVTVSPEKINEGIEKIANLIKARL